MGSCDYKCDACSIIFEEELGQQEECPNCGSTEAKKIGESK